MTAAPVLAVERLAIAYPTGDGTVQAVRDVSLAVAPGEIVGLVGESGCGKSTLAYAMLGDLGQGGVRQDGRVLFQGRDLLAMDARTLQGLRGAKIAMVHQNPGAALNPSVKIGRQLTEILAVHGETSSRAARARALDLLQRVHLPDAARLFERYPHELSGGQQQRVVIAAALLGEPDLLVLDEPTTGLDVTVEATVLDLLVEIRDAMGVAIVYIAHNLGVIARICERVGVMYAGELVELAGARDLFHQPRHPYTRSLLRCVPRADRARPRHGLAPIPGALPSPYHRPAGCAFADRCELVEARCRETRPALAPIAPERQVRCLRWDAVVDDAAAVVAPVAEPAAAGPAPPEVLTVAGMALDYRLGGGALGRRPSLRAVDDVSLAIRKGRVTAIVGESGCGKSSLAAGIVGLRPISAGTIRLAGQEVGRPVGKRPPLIHRLLQMVFQDHSATLNPSLAIGRIIGRPLQLFATVARREIAAETGRLLAAVGLDAATARRRPDQLSGGQRQRVAIARAFAGRPQVVVCDEITSALDVSVQASVLAFLLALQRRDGVSLIFISHDIGVVRYLADEVAVMYLGRLCETGPAEAVFAGPNHPYTEALLSAVPVPDPAAPRSRIRLEGPVPSALARPSGCPFHTRCPRKIGPICEQEAPPLRALGTGHRIACHLTRDQLARRQDAADSAPMAPSRRTSAHASASASANRGVSS